MRRAVTNSKNMSSCPAIRITRARAKTLAKQSDNVSQTNAKRPAGGEKKLPAGDLDVCPKRRAVFKDVTNVTRQNADVKSKNAGRDELSKRDKEVALQAEGEVAPLCIAKMLQIQEEKRESRLHYTNKKIKMESKEIVSVKSLTTEITEPIDRKTSCTLGPIFAKANHKDKQLYTKGEDLKKSGLIDIDTRDNDPQMCSQYVEDIYHHLSAAELSRRPSLDYMEKVQRDINPAMRAILVDWLVEVSDEYKMASDTLYLTVNLIDRFLSQYYIEKQKLQLLGVTCMLIASKYEEIYAPRVEEFCFITDNTYTKDEVVKMETCVLNCLSFQLSVPTTKKFLRRFLHAAQVSYEVPLAELEFLANYLAELTLTDYSFLKFLPSLIAASAVFLARWTLDQSDNPWNPTLEHYTRYKASELKTAVLELQELQLNTRSCPLKVIREKYNQSKFKCVSTLCSSKPVQSLF
ncbi:Cyclin-A2-2 [Striga hermonthica]|uniref:Cyclin-A2-2 n=1 Tax=Striga hermonthica TaxID=68872 RepID=A0A9N7RB02_STRHE|nr:Cyclin-A2-2 [Striga hermonthica]